MTQAFPLRPTPIARPRSARTLALTLGAAALLATAPLAALPARAQTQAPEQTTDAMSETQKPGIISVDAEGTARVAPDMAVISVTVLKEAETARAALDANSEAMEKVMAAMKEAGIEDRDMQTTNFSIQPRWVYPKPDDAENQEPRIVGYQVQNGLTVRVRDLAKVGEVLDTSVTLGVNQGGHIEFINDDPAAALSEARKEAIANARKKAEEMAEAAGVELGRITRISERADIGQPIPFARAEMAMAKDQGGRVPVATGENEYRVNVSMSWEIEQ